MLTESEAIGATSFVRLDTTDIVCASFRLVWLLVRSLLVLGICLGAQESQAMDQTDDIDTNRPSFMDSPLVVPKGSLQLENGALFQHFQHGLSTYDMPETELRVGLLKSTEFQVFVPNYTLFHRQSSAATDT